MRRADSIRGAVAASLLLCGLGPCAHAYAQPQLQPQPVCAAPDGCIDAILDAARAGRQADEFALLKQLRAPSPPRRPAAPKAVAPLPPSPSLPPSPPETPGIGDVDAASSPLAGDFADADRARALGYLNNGRPDAARRLLHDALRRDPVDAAYWSDLATVYARQGEHARAVGALVMADTWAFDRSAQRRSYRDAAGASAEPGLGQDFGAALQTIAAIEAEQARLDAALRAARAAAPAPKPATIDFSSCNTPVYPKASLRREETGSVTVAFMVGADGRVERFRKIASSAHPLLDNAALFSLAVCRFHPATLDGNPVPSWQPVRYVWALDDGTPHPPLPAPASASAPAPAPAPAPQ